MGFKNIIDATLRPATLAVALLVASAATAQSPTAAIQGQAAHGDVAIIQNVATGFSREVKPNKNGRYQLRNLPAGGTFSVTIKHPDGSLDAPKLVTLRVGGTARVL
jgi:hypothetical protein